MTWQRERKQDWKSCLWRALEKGVFVSSNIHIWLVLSVIKFHLKSSLKDIQNYLPCMLYFCVVFMLQCMVQNGFFSNGVQLFKTNRCLANWMTNILLPFSGFCCGGLNALQRPKPCKKKPDWRVVLFFLHFSSSFVSW